MTTALLEKQAPTTTYPELDKFPDNHIGFSPWTGVRHREIRRGIPKEAVERIVKAVPDFGMAVTVFIPGDYNADFPPGSHRDPLVIGEKDGKYYLIAAWE